MVDERIAAKNASEAVRKDKVVALFEFIGELNKLKQKVVLNVKDYSWWYPIADLPNDTDNIKIYNRDLVEEENTETITDVLLSVHKPEFQRCPAPDPIFEQWLDKGWDDYHGNADIKEFTYRSDDLRRVEAYKKWCVVRNIWAEKQRLTEQTRNIFFKLYNVYIDLERDSETLELIVADGFIRDRLTPTLDHPILTRRVKIRFDALENIIYIEDTDVSTKLYAAIFQNMENIDLASIDRLCDDQDVYKQHPLDNHELPKFFESFAHTLSSKSKYCDFDVPDRWGEGDDRLLLYRKPCFILRKRVNDAVKAIEQIVEHVKETGEVPSLICDIVDGGKNNITEDTEEPSIEERLAAVGGESIDILLSKEANREQLEIARRIERYNAVLVQGPLVYNFLFDYTF